MLGWHQSLFIALGLTINLIMAHATTQVTDLYEAGQSNVVLTSQLAI